MLVEHPCDECVDNLTQNDYGGYYCCDVCFFEVLIAPKIAEKNKKL
jgi:hypothetical protein